MREIDSLKYARVSTVIFTPGFATAACSWLRSAARFCRESVCASSGTPASHNTIPTMFAKVARGDETPENAAKAAEDEYKRIFARWK
jgi:hypothetical protein